MFDTEESEGKLHHYLKVDEILKEEYLEKTLNPDPEAPSSSWVSSSGLQIPGNYDYPLGIQCLCLLAQRTIDLLN